VTGKPADSELVPRENYSSISEFRYFLDRNIVQKTEGPTIAMPVLLNCAPEELPQLARSRDCIAEIERILPDVFALEVGLEVRHLKGYLVNSGDYWTVLLFPKRTDLGAADVVSRWCHHMFPRVAPCYITYLQMIDVVESLSTVEDSSTVIKEYFSRSLNGEGTIKRWPKNLSFSKDSVQRQAKKDGAIVDQIKFLFYTRDVKFEARLSRRGPITFYGGTFSEFQRLVLPGIVKWARANLERLHARKREFVGGSVEVQPVKIRTEASLTKGDMECLRKGVEKQYMTAVLYGGNPWLMLSLIDKSDGSTIDLQAYHDEIVIAPVVRASAESLARLYSILEEVLPLKIPQFS
jgi:hypothetical protein